MARTRRKITSGKPYELILRVSDRVPFIALELVKILLESALARTQRDNKVLICHHLWMGNHVHFIIVPLDPQQCVNFFQELQKKVTESYKSLTGQRSLKLWDGSAVLAEILDLDKAIEKIAYAYANPATANLTDKIEEYPGLSSFTQFLNANNSIDASFEIEVPYIRLYNIEPLKSLKVTEQEDRIYSQKLRNRAKRKHKLTLHFNAWIRAFGITDEKEVELVNQRIIEAVRRRELEARRLRIVEKKIVLGARELKRMRILAQCESKKRERRIFFHSSSKELRIAFLAAFKHFTEQCRKCYELLKSGIPCDWPPGAFRPPAPPLASAIF